MELSWSTFVLEIVNFLVLVWILKHFLYRPVLDVIARRQAGIEKRLTDAETLHADAEQLQTQYEHRLADWEQEKQQSRDALAQELNAERGRKLTELQSTLALEQEKARVANARREAVAQRKVEESALLQAAGFATRLLEQAAGPETEARLLELLVSELSGLSDERVASLRNAQESPQGIEVCSAFPLSDEQRRQLTRALERVAAAGVPVHFKQDQALLAGLLITIGSWVLAANIRDELKGFQELAYRD